MCNGLPRTTLSYSGDALRSFNVQPTSQLRRDVRKRLFSLRIWSPRYKHVNKGNSNVKQSFDHSVTVRKSVPGVKLGVINCQSISGKLDFVFDHIKEYQLDIVALTETWLSSEDSKNKHVIDQCVAHGYSLHHSPHTSGRRGGGVGLLVSNAIKVTFKRIHVSPLITSFELMEAVLTICSVSLRLIVIYRMPPSKINGLKTGTFYEEFSEYLEKLSCASGKVIILGDFNIFFWVRVVLHTNGLWIFLKLLIVYNILTSQHITVVIYLMINNKLKINDSKTEFIVFRSPQAKQDLSGLSVIVGDCIIQQSSKVRNLGIIFDQFLSFDDYISSVCRSTHFHLRNIGRIRHLLSQKATAQLIHALISIRLDYCNSILYNLPKNSILRLQRIQNQAARILTKTPRRDHITKVLIDLHWLRIEERIVYKLLILTFKAFIDRTAPMYLCELIEQQTSSTNTRTRLANDAFLLKLPPPSRNCSDTFFERSFTYGAPYEWNKLDERVRRLSNFNMFKSEIKTVLFLRYFNS